MSMDVMFRGSSVPLLVLWCSEQRKHLVRVNSPLADVYSDSEALINHGVSNDEVPKIER